MSTITTLASSDSGSTSRGVINTNFSNLNTDKAELASPTFTGTVTLPVGLTGIAKLTAGVVSAVTAPTGTIVGTSDSQTLTTKTLTTPIIATIHDTNDLPWVKSVATASAVNWITLTNSATGSNPAISVNGSDSNLDVLIYGKGTGKVKVSASYGDYTSDSDGATVTFDMSVSNKHTVTITANRTLAVSNVSTGQVFLITVKQDGTGSRTVTWFSGISWAGGSTPTLTTTASKADTFGFLCTAANTYYGFIIGQNI